MVREGRGRRFKRGGRVCGKTAADALWRCSMRAEAFGFQNRRSLAAEVVDSRRRRTETVAGSEFFRRFLRPGLRSSLRYSDWREKPRTFYNVVGVVKHTFGNTSPSELGAGSRAPRAAGRSSQTLDAAPSSPILDAGTKL